uniref:Uncharacterized protein n=1 Tax=Macaca mulatta TaxID=9544 RepID=A0A5F7Z7S3_MACMU
MAKQLVFIKITVIIKSGEVEGSDYLLNKIHTVSANIKDTKTSLLYTKPCTRYQRESY